MTGNATIRQGAEEQIKALEKQFECRIALSVRDGDSTETMLSYRGAELFHAASTMKVPVMVEVFRQAERGLLRMDDMVLLDPHFRSMIDDSIYEADAAKYLEPKLGTSVTILELVEQMIVVSDNLATNLLLTRIRPQAVTAMLREQGIRDGYILRCLMDIPAYEAGVSNRLTADGLTQLMQAINQDKVASPESCREMRRILEAQEYRDMIPAGLPEDIRVGNKTGSITAVAHDTAIVNTPTGPYYVSIMMDGLAKETKGSDIAPTISRMVFEMRNGLRR
jgi:beta-lactamase class A